MGEQTGWPKDDVHPRVMSEHEYGVWARAKIAVLEAELEAAKAREEAAVKWISQSIHEEGCRSFYDDQTGVCINEEPDINDPRCDCGLQEQFEALPTDLKALALAASGEETP